MPLKPLEFVPLFTRRPIATGLLICALTGGLAAAPPDLASSWLAHAVAVDGAPDEWPKMTALEKGVNATLANDGQFLYVTVSSDDASLRALMSTGLIVWLDPKGGKAQTFGIWVGGVEAPLLPGMSADSSPTSSSRGRSLKSLTEFDLLGPGKNQRRLIDLTPGLGLEIATGTDDGMITYELKIPLTATADREYAVSAAAGSTIGLGLATPEAPRERRRGPLVGSGGRVGGNPYWGGANGGGFAQFPEQEERTKPLEIWTTVKLASAP